MTSRKRLNILYFEDIILNELDKKKIEYLNILIENNWKNKDLEELYRDKLLKLYTTYNEKEWNEKGNWES